MTKFAGMTDLFSKTNNEVFKKLAFPLTLAGVFAVAAVSVDWKGLGQNLKNARDEISNQAAQFARDIPYYSAR